MVRELFSFFTAGVIQLGSVLGFGTYLEPTWTMIVTGDIIPARSVNFQMTKRNDFLWPIRDIAPLLASGDITVIDLESPLVPGCPLTNSGFTFCTDPRFADSLQKAGVDVANIANNHTLNYGWQGIQTTEQLLSGVGIETTGHTTEGECANQAYFCSEKTIKTIHGIRLGFLGYNIVGKKVDREALTADIAGFNDAVDILIVSYHWGKEYTRIPLGEPDDPREIARLSVDNGADVIIGNHPHWIQGMEYYQDKPIFYALGNTIFDQEWSRETKEGLIAEIQFEGKTIKDIVMHPLLISDYGHAQLLEGEEKEKLLEIFREASEML